MDARLLLKTPRTDPLEDELGMLDAAAEILLSLGGQPQEQLPPTARRSRTAIPTKSLKRKRVIPRPRDQQRLRFHHEFTPLPVLEPQVQPALPDSHATAFVPYYVLRHQQEQQQEQQYFMHQQLLQQQQQQQFLLLQQQMGEGNRRKRRKTSTTESVLLRKVFDTGVRHPSMQLRRELALAVGNGMTERQIQVWFQNRRQKMKKNLGPDSPIAVPQGEHLQTV